MIKVILNQAIYISLFPQLSGDAQIQYCIIPGTTIKYGAQH